MIICIEICIASKIEQDLVLTNDTYKDEFNEKGNWRI